MFCIFKTFGRRCFCLACTPPQHSLRVVLNDRQRWGPGWMVASQTQEKERARSRSAGRWDGGLARGMAVCYCESCCVSSSSGSERPVTCTWGHRCSGHNGWHLLDLEGPMSLVCGKGRTCFPIIDPNGGLVVYDLSFDKLVAGREWTGDGTAGEGDRSVRRW